MNPENNKSVARNLTELLGRGQVEDALRLLADDLTWSVQGLGTFDKNGMRGNWRQVFSTVSGESVLRIREMTAEADRVAVEIDVDIKLPDGRDYRTTISALMVIRDGKVAEAREYLDTAYVQKTFGPEPT